MAKSPVKRLLGPLKPLLGHWTHTGDSDLGPLTCTRRFQPILGGHRVQLDAVWSYADEQRDDYVELCLFGADGDGALGFQSFINDGSQSLGTLADGTDIDPGAICFEAEMPHGLARQTYWPDGKGGWDWRVERKVKAGWSALVEHHYVASD